MTNDPIADFLTRMRNSLMRRARTLALPATNELSGVAKILKDEGYISDFKIDSVEGKYQKEISVVLAYDDAGKSKVTKLIRVSKPGLRRYMGYREIPKVLNGLGISIFSTPKGLMTGKDARKQKIGGEFLCKIW